MTSSISNSAPRVILPEPVAAVIVAAARRAEPREACGLLVGRVTAEGVEVVRSAPARNVHARPTERFHLAPEDFLAAEKRARAEALAVAGFWHSHPASPAVPSVYDRAAAWEGYSYLIVSLAMREPELRSWRLRGERLVEERVVAAGVPTRVGR